MEYIWNINFVTTVVFGLEQFSNFCATCFYKCFSKLNSMYPLYPLGINCWNNPSLLLLCQNLESGTCAVMAKLPRSQKLFRTLSDFGIGGLCCNGQRAPKSKKRLQYAACHPQTLPPPNVLQEVALWECLWVWHRPEFELHSSEVELSISIVAPSGRPKSWPPTTGRWWTYYSHLSSSNARL